MQEKIKQWEEDFYPFFLRQAQKELLSRWGKECESFSQMLQEEVDTFFQQLSEEQAKGEGFPKIAQVTTSFLFTSFFFGEPVFQLDAYGVGGRAQTKSLISRKMEAPWLTKALKNLEEGLYQQSRKDGLARYLRPMKLSLYSLRALRALLFFLGNQIKYSFDAVGTLPSYLQLQKETSFLFTFGEYMDWQRPLYGEFLPLVLREARGKKPFSFRYFLEQYYEEPLGGLFVTHSHFQNCVFTKGTIQNCRFLDCTFEGCQFLDLKIEATKFLGSRFINTRFQNVSISQTFFAATKESAEEEIYRNVWFQGCQFFLVSFFSCALRATRLLDCQVEAVTEKESEGSNSDFWVYF